MISVLGVSLTSLIHPAPPQGRYAYHSHFTDEETLTKSDGMTYSRLPARQDSNSGGLASEPVL